MAARPGAEQTVDLPDSIDWPTQTREWWGAWVGSDVTADWTPLQWHYLLDTALIHATVWGSGDMAKASELRARVERLGGLPEKSKVSLVQHVQAEPADVRGGTPLDEFTSRRRARGAGA